MDDGEVAARPDRRHRDQRDGEPRQEAPARGGGGRHRPPPGSHEERDEHTEADEVAEREVDDPGQPVDERVPDREQPVDAAGRETRQDDLQGQIHRRSLMTSLMLLPQAASAVERSR